MTHTFSFTVKVNETNEQFNITVNLSEEELTTLERFLEFANDLLKTKLVKDGIPSKLQLSFSNDSSMKFFSELPNWNDVIIFLHKLRPFELQNEQTWFPKISNYLKKIIPNEYIRKGIDEQRDKYNGKSLSKLYKITVNDIVINSQEIFSKWLNAFEYHHEEEKRKFIKRLQQVFPEDAQKSIFINLLSEKARAIYNIAALINIIIHPEARKLTRDDNSITKHVEKKKLNWFQKLFRKNKF